MMGCIAGIILAAGASRRLGTPKQTLLLAGQPVLSYTVQAARDARLDPIVVVLGHRADDIRRQVDLDAVQVIRNPEYATGQSSSVRLAVRSLPADVDAAVFLLGDQPLVAPTVITRLVVAYQEGNGPIVQPRYAEGRGNPVLISRELFPALLELTGDTGARPLLKLEADRVQFVDASDHHRPDDIDTWEDYERLQAEFGPQEDGNGT